MENVYQSIKPVCPSRSDHDPDDEFDDDPDDEFDDDPDNKSE